jgi:hypothetical protein
MARPRRDYLKHTHTLVLDWAHWTIQHIQSSAIGYPKQTVEASLQEQHGSSGPAKSIAPDVMMPGSVARIDRAMRTIPADLYLVIQHKYFSGDEVSKHKHNAALMWVAGNINSHRSN